MRLRLVGLRFTGLVHGNHQMDLFEDTEEFEPLPNHGSRLKPVWRPPCRREGLRDLIWKIKKDLDYVSQYAFLSQLVWNFYLWNKL